MFNAGTTYIRKQLHAKFGGQQQGGICTPTGAPAVFLITGDSGHAFGYSDGFRPDGTFWYTGEGQAGDMDMVRGNRAIRDHEVSGKQLFVFEDLGKGRLRSMGEARYLGHHVEVSPDKNGKPRNAIVFELAMEPSDAGDGTVPDLADTQPRVPGGLWNMSLDALRTLASEPTVLSATPAERKSKVQIRSDAVKVYVLRRAGGFCESCDQPAPFVRKDGTPYLEPHHVLRRADDGPDHPAWVAAICPNCHRRVHSGKDGATFNEAIAKKIHAREPPQPKQELKIRKP